MSVDYEVAKNKQAQKIDQEWEILLEIVYRELHYTTDVFLSGDIDF